MKTKLFILILCLFVTNLSCQTSEKTSERNQAVVKLTFQAKGVVKEINLEKKKLKLDHEEIKGYMEAMTMDFYVNEKDLLENIKVGDKINFTLKHEAGIDTITEIRKIQ